MRTEINSCIDYLQQTAENEMKRKCPQGYVQCLNGDCKMVSSLCDDNLCPINKPYRCPEGICVHDKSLCDNIINGCPYNKNLKCPDGTCVNSTSNCVRNSTEFCPDGSLKQDGKVCPQANGCLQKGHIKCADGTCIDNTTSKCPTVVCPIESPIKCLTGGECVASSSLCLSIVNEAYIKDDGDVICADGRKVVSFDYCRINITNCQNGKKKCDDGTCRLKDNECPLNIITSSVTKEDCTNCLGECNNTLVKEDCDKEKVPYKQNGCPNENKVRCHDGRCLKSEKECLLSSKYCPNDTKTFLCNDGTCVSNLMECKNEDDTYSEENQKQYHDDKFKKEHPTNEIGCPLVNPYRCLNGECVESQRKCKIFTEKDKDGKVLNNLCDSSKPFLCKDFSCKSDPEFCKIIPSCPSGKIKCFNGYCVSKTNNSTECAKYQNYCPLTNPIKCPSGSCSTDILKCTEGFYKESCNDGEFYCVRLGKCLTNKFECLGININNKTQTHYCYDGTIVDKGETCPVVPSCKIGQFRCKNGACAYNCSLVDVPEIECPEKTAICPDGICHANCDNVLYQGCQVGEYQCSNGMCVKSELECIGYSMCDDPAVPFRCINGECKSNVQLCPEIERLTIVKNISYSFHKYNPIKFDFAFDQKGRNVGRISIPSNAIKMDNYYSIINVEEIPYSLISGNSLYNDSELFLYNISNSIAGSDGQLNSENSLMSPAFKFFSASGLKMEFKISALLEIKYNTIPSDYLLDKDYCLAKLSNFDMKNNKTNSKGVSKWECVQRIERKGQNQFALSSFGVYAVILNPLREQSLADGQNKNYIYEQITYLVGIVVSIIVVGFGIFYVFMRIFRYRGKYHRNLAKIEKLNRQREEFAQIQTDVFGQSLGDNLLGIVFAKNPGFSEGEEEVKEGGGGIENEIEEIQRKIKIMECQNEKLQNHLDKLEAEYKDINDEIATMKGK